MQKARAWQAKPVMAASMNRIVDTNAASVRRLSELQVGHGADVGVILVQVDQLARINHSAGSETGDALLEKVARRLETFAGAESGHGADVERPGGTRFHVLPGHPSCTQHMQGEELALHTSGARRHCKAGVHVGW